MVKLNILDFGAKESDILQTKEIQSCIDKCFLMGGGEVIIPCGVFRTGGLRLRSNVTLHLLSGAILEGSDDPKDYYDYLNDEIEPIVHYERTTRIEKSDSVYPYTAWNNALIRVINAENVSIIGEVGSYIDGVNCYDSEGEENYRGPHAINIQSSKNIKLEGYCIRNSANWAHAIFRSQNINVKNIKVLGGHDGFDVRTCDNVNICDSAFYCGDDCIAGFDNIDVKVENCIFSCACNAIRFGGTNVHIKSCKSIGPSYFAHRYFVTDERKKAGKMATADARRNTESIYNYYCDFRADIRQTPGNILIEDCSFDDFDAVMISLFGAQIWCTNRPLKSIKFKNCKFTHISKPSFILGSDDEPMILEFEDCVFETVSPIPFARLARYEKISFKNSQLIGFSKPELLVDKMGIIESDIEIDTQIDTQIIPETSL